jgi:short-subunit dehydrogenase
MKTSTLLKLAAVVGAVAGGRAILRGQRRIELRGQVVVITGASRGLGLVLARQLIQRGARVAICARHPDELERARIDLNERGGRVYASPCDVTDRDDIQRFIAEARDELGPIDVLINNAGVVHVGPMELMNVDDYEQAMRTHLWAPLHATLAVLPEMRARRAGRIVNIASIGGKIAIPHLVPYSASKFALVGMSAAMRAELAQDNVFVTTVCPGLMRTGSPRHALFKGQHRAEYAWFATSDALPFASMNADRAAHAIIDALVHGDAEVVLSVPARIVAKLYGLAPNLVDEAFGLLARLLPASNQDRTTVEGKDAESPLAPSVLTTLGDAAARRNNEV